MNLRLFPFQHSIDISTAHSTVMMNFIFAAMALTVGLAAAAPANDPTTITRSLEYRAARSDCGQYKFDDGTVQYFYSQV